MLFPKRNEENLLRRSLMNRFKANVLKQDSVTKHKERLRRCSSDSFDIGQRARARSLPSEAELRKYLGPVEQGLVENAEIAKQRRRKNDKRRYSIQGNPSDDRTLEAELRPKAMSLSRCFPAKRTPFNFVRCKWYEPIELPGAIDQNDNDCETYIDENGIYTTVLCFTEI